MRSAKGSVKPIGPNHWRVRVEGPQNPNTGKRTQLSKNVRGSRKQAEEAKLRLLAEAGADISDSAMTLSQYMDAIYTPAKESLIESGKFKRKTLSEYKRRLRLHVLPTFGKVPLRDITAPRIKSWVSSFDKPTIAKEALKTLSSVLSFAVYDMQLQSNPCDRVKPPETKPYDPQPLDVEDIEVYLYWFRGTTIEAAVLLAIGGGLRRGEICALDVSDIDFTTGAVTIDDAYITIGGEAVHETPKSKSGNRIVHLPRVILERLREIVPDNGPVLRGRSGRMFPDAVSRTYRRVQATMPKEVPHIPLKDLRHSSLTLAYEAGAEALALKDRGGHASIDTTRKYYVRPRGRRDAKIADAMDSLLSEERLRKTINIEVYEDTWKPF